MAGWRTEETMNVMSESEVFVTMVKLDGEHAARNIS
jgi:hypothetical protein